jgi:hypothetical protein
MNDCPSLKICSHHLGGRSGMRNLPIIDGFQITGRHRYALLRSLEQVDQETLEDHVHRAVGLGA